MAKRYVFVRMPADVFETYVNIKQKMEKDISSYTGKPTVLPMTQVFRAVSPQLNENFIQVDLGKLVKLSRGKR